MLKTSIDIKDKTYSVSLDFGYDISIEFANESEGPNCFYAPGFKATPLKSGDFVGAIEFGSPVNFYNVEINPHGNGTHTECVGHISKEKVFIKDVCPNGLLLSQLITIKPTTVEDDLVITVDCLPTNIDNVETLIVRTLPNDEQKRVKNYSGTNPTYFDPLAIKHIVDLGIKHLIVDLPSIDREEDGGAMLSHKAFWKYDEILDTEKTISELVYIPDTLSDGLYLCSINAIAFKLDAAPSRIILFPLILEDE